MSIPIKVGGKEYTIPGEGVIDTPQEAEAALAYLPEGSTDTVNDGTAPYTRDQLLAIRGNGSAQAPAAGLMGQGNGVSHGIRLEGLGAAGLGRLGHSGGGAVLSYSLGVPLKKGDGLRLHMDIVAGGAVSHASLMNLHTPGGEKVTSAFTSYGASLGADGRLVPSFLDHRMFLTFGFRLNVGGFSTPDSKTVSTPGKCTPDDFGRSDCNAGEPSAGPTVGNAGTQGLWDPRLNASRGTSGAIINLYFPLTIGGSVLRDSWGSLDLFGGPLLGLNYLFPKDGQGFNFVGLGGEGGLVVRFGGSDAYVPQTSTQSADKDGDGVADKDDQCPDVAGTKENKGCPADKDKDGVPDIEDKCPDVPGVKENAGCAPYAASVTSSPDAVQAQGKFSVGLNVGSSSRVRVAFKDDKGVVNNSNSVLIDEGNSKSPFDVPADLKAGKYTLVVTFEDMATHTKKVEEKSIIIFENVTTDLPGSFAPNQPPTLSNVKVNGMEKLEGVTYVIEGFDKDKKSIGTLDSNSVPKGDKNWTLEDKRGTRIPLSAPGGKGFKKEINYVVTLKNKEGRVIWTGTFEVGQTQPGGPQKPPIR